MTTEKVIIIIYGLLIMFHVWIDHKINKEKDKIIDEVMNFNKELIKRNSEFIEKESKILKLIEDGKKTKEVCYITLEKIEKELL